MNGHSIALFSALFALTAIVAMADRSSLAARKRPGTGPPPEAFEACREKSEGTAVEITTPRGDTIKATCRRMNGQLVAVPEGEPSGHENGGPPKDGENGQ